MMLAVMNSPMASIAPTMVQAISVDFLVGSGAQSQEKFLSFISCIPIRNFQINYPFLLLIGSWQNTHPSTHHLLPQIPPIIIRTIPVSLVLTNSSINQNIINIDFHFQNGKHFLFGFFLSIEFDSKSLAHRTTDFLTGCSSIPCYFANLLSSSILLCYFSFFWQSASVNAVIISGIPGSQSSLQFPMKCMNPVLNLLYRFLNFYVTNSSISCIFYGFQALTRSDLFPKTAKMVPRGHSETAVGIQYFSRSSIDFGQVRSQTKMTALLLLYRWFDIDLQTSWPEVSHNSKLTVFCLYFNFLFLKSMPTVDCKVSTNVLSAYRRIRELLPAPLMPTNMTEKLSISFFILSSKSAILPIQQQQFQLPYIFQDPSFSKLLPSPFLFHVYLEVGQWLDIFKKMHYELKQTLDKFIMRTKKNTNNPEIELSFTKQNNQQQQQNNRLNVQLLRVHATEKQRILQDIWRMDQQELCNYFTSYRLFPQELFTLNDLLNSTNLKLIKHDGKIYFGQIDRKKKSGKGICVYKEGKLYEGEFLDNQRTGYGIEIYSNGNLYIGEFLNNKKHGKGKFFWFNLNVKSKQPSKNIEYYQGDWWGGLPDGEGVHQKNNGDLYRGTFKNGLKHGIGSESYGNGDFYKGEYINGLPEGFGEYQWSDGSSYKGDFKQGLRSGYGIWNMNNSQYSESYQGHYTMDKKSGYGVYEWQNGWIYKGNFQNDYRNGFGELYDGEKCMYRGYWVNGEQAQNQQIPTSKTARTTASIQMSRASGTKLDRNFYETIDTKQFGMPIESRITPRPQYSIKKRPQSYSNIGKYQTNPQSEKKNKREDNYEKEGMRQAKTVEKSLLKLNNLYVPGINSSRARR